MSIYDLMDQVRQHPDFVSGVIFTTHDFHDQEAMTYDNTSLIEDAMTRAGFETAEELGFEQNQDAAF